MYIAWASFGNICFAFREHCDPILCHPQEADWFPACEGGLLDAGANQSTDNSCRKRTSSTPVKKSFQSKLVSIRCAGHQFKFNR